MNGKYDIDEPTFKHMDREDQLWMMFQTFNSQRNECDDRFCGIEEKVGCLQKRRKGDRRKDTAIAAGAGLFGGFLAMLSKIFLLK